MSLWQRCKCGICNCEWSYDVKYQPPTKRNDLCEKCELKIEELQRNRYFNKYENNRYQDMKSDLRMLLIYIFERSNEGEFLYEFAKEIDNEYFK